MKIILLFLILALTTCKKTSNNNSGIEVKSKKKKEYNISEIKNLIINNKWNLISHDYSDKTLIFHNIKSRDNNSDYGHIFQFKNDGEILIEKISKSIGCANGSKILLNGSWNLIDKTNNDEDIKHLLKALKTKENTDNQISLILNIEGLSFLEYEYKYKRRYSIEFISENQVRLSQKESLMEYYKKMGI